MIRSLLLIVLLGAAAGCSVFESVLKRPARVQPEAEAVGARSPVDSVWNSGAPVDTVFLRPLPAGAAALPAGALERRRAPASVEIGAPELVAGYRVQLASSPERSELAALVRRVEREFGGTAYLEEQEGFFTLRIGAFLDREDAAAEREHALSYGYKQAWIVQSYFSPGEVKRKEQ